MNFSYKLTQLQGYIQNVSKINQYKITGCLVFQLIKNNSFPPPHYISDAQ